MAWKIDSRQPIDADLRDAVQDKIDDGTFGMADLKDYFTVFAQICNNTEDAEDEMEDFDRRFQFKIDGKPAAWFNIENCKIEIGSGSIESPDITLEMSGQLAVDIFSGQVDPTQAYMNGDLKVDGIINDAIVFKDILEVVQDEME